MKKLNSFDIARIISIIILTLAAFVFDRHTPYGVYTFLRIVVTLTSIYAIFIYDENRLFQFFFGALAILYNPIIKIHLSRDIWEILNIITLLLLSISYYLSKKSSKQPNSLIEIPNSSNKAEAKPILDAQNIILNLRTQCATLINENEKLKGRIHDYKFSQKIDYKYLKAEANEFAKYKVQFIINYDLDDLNANIAIAKTPDNFLILAFDIISNEIYISAHEANSQVYISYGTSIELLRIFNEKDFPVTKEHLLKQKSYYIEQIKNVYLYKRKDKQEILKSLFNEYKILKNFSFKK